MTVRRPNFFHGHGMPAARPGRRTAAGDGESDETQPDSPAEPVPAPAAAPGRRPWSIFHAGPTWPARRVPDDPK
jgi:hypothetical protein